MSRRRGLHRNLARRLLIGGLAVAAAIGGLTLFADIERIDDSIVDLAVAEAGRLSPLLPGDLTSLDATGRAAVDATLEGFVAERAQGPGGHFIIAEIYDLAQKTVADGLAKGAETVEKSLDDSKHVFPEAGGTWYSKVLLDGQLYLQVVAPIVNSGKVQIGWFEGVYSVPYPVMLSVAGRGLRTSGLVILSVLAATALLYPLIASLHGDLLARSQALLDANIGTLEVLGNAIAKRDSDTGSHNYRVTLYAVRLAEALGLPASVIQTLIKGAFLHDVGKIAIPDAILLKPGRLDEEEFGVMKTHVAHGLDIVADFGWLSDAAEVVGGHHEKYDGSGYLSGKAGEEIPISARVFAVADVFDALTSQRPYKKPLPLAEALAIMTRERGRHFDPAVLDAFVAIAPDLHAEVCCGDALKAEMRAVVGRYFAFG
ncbi:MAG: HD-GYP domain-containing protein [Solirubrobacterales bacterium]